MTNLMYAPVKPYGDNNIFEPNFTSLRQSITTSFTGQIEPLFTNIHVKIPYVPKTTDDDYNSLFEINCYDRIMRSTTAFVQNSTFRIEDTDSVSLKSLQPIPLSAKSNWCFRWSASDIKYTFIITSSSIVQGAISFYIARGTPRAFTQGGPTSKFNQLHTIDMANSVGHINLANDKNVTIDIPYDEVYNMIDYGSNGDVGQKGIRTLVTIPFTPITTTTGDPAEIWFTLSFGVTNTKAAGFINAPNLTMFTRKIGDITSKTVTVGTKKPANAKIWQTLTMLYTALKNTDE